MRVLQVLRGCFIDKSNSDQLQLQITIPSFELRVFISSTFSDTKIERDVLMKAVLPALELKARAHGVQVIMVDMRYGVPDENTRDHLTWTTCEKALQTCIANSDGIFCLSMQGMKYGYRPLPKYLAKTDFEDRLLNAAKDDVDLANNWYFIDENNVPPVYVLRPLDGVNDDMFWEYVKPKLLKLFDGVNISSPALGDTDGGLKVGQSMTEWETRVGLFAKSFRQLRTFNAGSTMIHHSHSRSATQFVFLHRKFQETAEAVRERMLKLDANISALKSKASDSLKQMIDEHRDVISTLAKPKTASSDSHDRFEIPERGVPNLSITNPSELRAVLSELVSKNNLQEDHSDNQVILPQDKLQEISHIIDLIDVSSLELRYLESFCDEVGSEEENVEQQHRVAQLKNLIEEHLDEEYIEVSVEKSIFEHFHREDGNEILIYLIAVINSTF